MSIKEILGDLVGCAGEHPHRSTQQRRRLTLITASFWKIMSPNGGGEPSGGALAERHQQRFRQLR